MRYFINVLLVISLLSVLSGFLIPNEDILLKPEHFPENTVKLVTDNLSETCLLDTVYLMSFNYIEFLKELPEGKEEFQTVNNKQVAKYFDYLYVKNILATLGKIESNSNNIELKRNLLFKVDIQLTNRHISKSDLLFVYKNWDLDQIKQK